MDNDFDDIEKSLNERLDLITTRNKESPPSMDPDTYSNNLEEDLIIGELRNLASDINSTINIVSSYIINDNYNPIDQRLESKQIANTSKKLLVEQIAAMNMLARKLLNEEVQDGKWR